jgi:YVTN family beta-propeller protein
MSEYRKQIILAVIVAIVIASSVGFGILYLPGHNSTSAITTSTGSSSTSRASQSSTITSTSQSSSSSINLTLPSASKSVFALNRTWEFSVIAYVNPNGVNVNSTLIYLGSSSATYEVQDPIGFVTALNSSGSIVGPIALPTPIRIVNVTTGIVFFSQSLIPNLSFSVPGVYTILDQPLLSSSNGTTLSSMFQVKLTVISSPVGSLSTTTTSSSTLATSVTTASTSSSSFGSSETQIQVGGAPYGIAYDPATGTSYVAVSGTGNVAIIDNQSKLAGYVSLENQSSDFVAYDPISGLLYTYLQGNNTVVVTNPARNSILGDVSFGAGPGWLSYDPASNLMYVVCRQSNAVYLLSGLDIQKSITLSGLPFAAAYDPADGNMYVTSQFGLVFVINGTSNSLIRSFQVGSGSSTLLGIAYDPQDKQMYVTSYGNNDVYAINSTAVTQTISGFNEPIGIAFDTNAGGMYGTMFVVNSGNSTVSSVSSSSLCKGCTPQFSTIGVGPSPREVIFDQAIDSIIVTNYGGTTVSIISA